MPHRSTVSVAMCTYNGARFLQQQLDSIVTQSRLPDEMVVCDDQSTDATAEIVREFASAVPFPVRFIRNEVRLRFAANFAKCIGLCTGDVIVLTDQDDVWMPKRVEISAEAFEANPQLTFTFSDAPLIDENGNRLGRTIFDGLKYPKRDLALLARGDALLPFLLRYAGLLGCTMAIRGRLRESFLPLPEPYPHDTWASMVLSSLGPSMRTEPVTQYRQHTSQYVGAEMQSRLGRLKSVYSENSQAAVTEMQHTQNAINTAMQHPELRGGLLQALEERMVYLQARYTMKQSGMKGFATWFRLVVGQEYGRHGSGLRTATRDFAVMLRGLLKGATPA